MSGTLTFKQASSIGQSAIRAAEARGKHVSIAVVNHDGRPLTTLAMEQAAPYTDDIALRKARLSALTHESTRQVRDAVRSGDCTQAAYGLSDIQFVPWAGGFPIFKKGICIGGIGVSNLEEEEDAEIAETAVREAGFSVYTDGYCFVTDEGISQVHHIGIGLPSIAIDALYLALVQRGAIVISGDRKKHQYFLLLNQSDSTLIELFVEIVPSIHVDYVVASLATIEAIHGDIALTTYPGLSNLRFLDLVATQDFGVEVQLAFRQE